MEGSYSVSLVFKDSGGSTITTAKVNVPVTGNFTFLDNDVRALYIDWGDGESSNKTESNYQWLEFTEPTQSASAVHTYNKQGNMVPIVQTITSQGIASRYYGSATTIASLVPYSKNIAISAMAVVDDSPIANMRVENTAMNSGIDNSVFEDSKQPLSLYLGVAPTLSQTELAAVYSIVVDITGIVAYNKYDKAQGNNTQLALGSAPVMRTIRETIDVRNTGVQNNLTEINATDNLAFLKVLKVEFINVKSNAATGTAGTDYTYNELINRLKIFLLAKTNTTAYGDEYVPITYVTGGDPIKGVDDKERFSIMDMSQSRTAASNLTISNYRYDDGKLWFNPYKVWALDGTILGVATKQTNPNRSLHYTYNNRLDGLNNQSAQSLFYSGSNNLWYKPASNTPNGTYERLDQLALDDYGRFYDQYHLVRDSVVSSSTSGSSIVTNQPEVIHCVPSLAWTSAANITTTNATSYTDKMKNNGKTNVFTLNNINATQQADILGVAISEGMEEYIILTFDSPTNKVFFNATNYANSLMSDLAGFGESSGLKISGVEYLHVEESGNKSQNAYWKPLLFKDTTRISREVKKTTTYDTYHTCFAKSGYINYDMPIDWSPISIKKLCGGVYNTAAATLSEAIQAGTDDVTITGSATTIAGTSMSGYGNGLVSVTLNAAGDKTAMETIGTSEDVGAYRYAFIVTNGTGAGGMFWLASGGSTGYDGTQGSHGKVYLQVGETGTSATNGNYTKPAGTITGSVRRINIYDVVNGASKVFSDTNVVPNTGAARLIPVGGNTFNPGSSYFTHLYNTDQSALKSSSWATNDKYALKITLSGATGAGTLGSGAPEIWNIFDASQSDSAIIKEVDSSAYNLNSLAITSYISISQAGNYFKAITRKGKTYVVKTGISMSSVAFSSVALGDVNSSTAFADHGPETLYGHLHMVRKLQSDAVPVYWDEPQKDGTFARLWGLITDISENLGVDGPRSVTEYTFNMTITKVALIGTGGSFYTDIFPLGGLKYERDYS